MVGVTMFPPFMCDAATIRASTTISMPSSTPSTCGEDHVGIGTDFTQDVTNEGMQYFVHDKGYGRRLLEIKEVVNPMQFARIEQYPNLTAGMERRKWGEQRIRKVLGENWIRIFGEPGADVADSRFP